MGTLKHPAALDELLLYRLYILQKAGRDSVGEQSHARAIEIGTRYSEALTSGLSDDEAAALDSMLTALTARAKALATTTDNATHV